MEKKLKELLIHSSELSKEELVQGLNDIFGSHMSEIDRWYAIGADFWLRRTTPTDYLCVQTYPIMDVSYLCYLHVLDIEKYESKVAEQYRQNVSAIPNTLPSDIQYMYPVAFSQDVDNAAETFLAANEEEKTEWLNKMGIK